MGDATLRLFCNPTCSIPPAASGLILVSAETQLYSSSRREISWKVVTDEHRLLEAERIDRPLMIGLIHGSVK